MSALDNLTKDIMETKLTKATKLTPVGVESSPTQPSLAGRHQVNFPYDEADIIQQSIRRGLDAVAEAKRELEFVGAGLIKLAQLYGLPDEEPLPEARPNRTDRPVTGGTGVDPTPGDEYRSAEAAFAASFAAKQAAAQAATFHDDESPEGYLPVVGPTDGWVCPKHGADNLLTITSRKGRVYRTCTTTNCPEFEK
jgi:hypothetical protein